MTATLQQRHAWLSAYPAGNHDEARDAQGVLRPQWLGLAAAVGRAGPGAMTRRWQEAERLLREHAAVHALTGSSSRPWRLDPVPLVLSGDDWRLLAAGVAQRARLLDRLLGDCYGAQRLLQSGRLPAASVYAHPGYLRPCVGLEPAEGQWLRLFACDVVRHADGRWHVVGEHAQVPLGSGYALENRIVLTRAWSDLYARLGVARLSGYFAGLRRSLQRAGGGLTAVLTPGPGHPHHVENAFLACYTGTRLVEPGDLTVRSDGLSVNDLEGLQRIDVLVRRCRDADCDPLELGGGGVPGLLHALRRGQVAVINPPGTGLAENPRWHPHLPRLCCELLEEELLLPSASIVDPLDPAGDVAGNLERLIVRPNGGATHEHLHAGATLTNEQREALLARIAAEPWAWLGQEALQPSTTPCLIDGAWQARSLTLRLYAWGGPEGWQVMPGGLARSAATGGSGPALAFDGCKDVWVIDREEANRPSLLPSPTAPVAIRRAAADLTGRVADDLFWLGRYLERAEDGVRLLRSWHEAGENGQHHAGAVAAEAMLLRQRSDLPVDEPAALVAAWAGGLAAGLEQVVGLAGRVRDRLSRDTWRTISLLRHEAADLATVGLDGLGAGLDRLLPLLVAIAGLHHENGTRHAGWRFADLGRRLERALFICDCCAATAALAPGPDALLALLEVGDSTITYRTRYRDAVQAAPVFDLLLCDPANPRSLAFQLQTIAAHLRALPAPVPGSRPAPLPRDDALVAAINAGRGLGPAIAGVATALDDLTAWISEQYVSHSAPAARDLALATRG